MSINFIYVKAQSLMEKAADKLSAFAKKTLHFFLHPNPALLTCYLLILVAIGCFGYTWINYNFTVPLGGDYTLQEMTFLFNGYDDWHTFFRTGHFPTWDRSVFLGIDNIGGNSFYYLFDPFFLLCLIFPRDWLLVLQGLSFVPKMVIAGMFFYWYLGSFGYSPKTRRIGALCFGFSAYSFSYLWFHFIDSVAFLPLVLLGVERILKDRDPRIFLVGFFLNAMASYFFFVEFMFGAFFYAVFRYFQTIHDRNAVQNWDTLGIGFLSFVVAVLLGCFTLLPGMSIANQMPRVSSASYLDTFLSAEGFKAKLDALLTFTGSTKHNQVTPLLNFLFMYDGCYYSNLLNVYWYDNLAAGLYATTPMLLMFFVALVDSIRQKKWSHLIGLALVLFLVFTPVGFYLFSGFTVAYARYFIIPIAWMIVYDCRAIERRREIPRNYLDLSFVITAGLMVVCCLLMIYEVNLEPDYYDSTDWDYRMFLIPASLAWLTVCYFVLRHFFHKRKYSSAIFLLSSIDIIVMANLTIQMQGLSTASMNSDIPTESKIVELLKRDENNEDYYRIYNTSANRNNINLSLREGYQGLGAFHSVYPYSTQNFLDRSRIPYTYHNWSMGIHNRRYNLETFLGTKYYLVDRVDPSYVNDRDNYTHLGTPLAYPTTGNNHTWATDYDIPYGYKDVTTFTKEEMTKLGVNYSDELIDYLKSDQCNKSLYVNTDFVDFAFAYDQVINEYWLGSSNFSEDEDPTYNLYEDENEYPLLRAAILTNSDYKTFLSQGKYNAGTYTINGHTVDIENSSKTMAGKASTFRASQRTYNLYREGSGGAIQVYTETDTWASRFKVTVYSSNWPNTEDNPTGEYATCDPSDPSDSSCLEEYAKTNPWEYANGIYPGDTKIEHKSGQTVKLLYNSKIVITPVDQNGNASPILPEADPSDPTTGGYISIFNNQNIEWRLYDKDGKVISFAKHSYAEYKQAHGYYADRPVYKIVGIVQEGTKDDPVLLKVPTIYVQRNKDYQAAIDKLKEEPITIKNRTDDEVAFETNYSKDKFVVLNYPVSDGWNLYEIKNGKREKVKTYTAQGGFISFEGLSGNHTYVLSYSSPNFKLGMMLTSFGLFITMLAFMFYTMRNKHHRFDDDSSLRKRMETTIRKEKWEYVNFENELR
jgi:uncharacterized membrane protein YfhO